jgi:hypothetical protein
MTRAQTVAAFAVRPKDASRLGRGRDDLARVCTQALAPAHVSVWASHRDGGWLRMRTWTGNPPGVASVITVPSLSA